MPDYRAEDVMLRSADWLKRNRGVVAALAGLLVIVAVVLVYGQTLKNQHEREAEAYYRTLPSSGPGRLMALRQLVTDYSDTSIGVFIKLSYADELLGQRQYAQAEMAYTHVLTGRSQQDIYWIRAKLGLAYCAQELRDYERARKYYEELKIAGGPYTAEAEHMLELLKDPPTIPMNVQVPVTSRPTVPEGPSTGSAGEDTTN